MAKSIRKTGSFEGKSNRLGGGGRFRQVEKAVAAKGAKNPGALAAYIGRRSLGKEKFQKLAVKGRERAAYNREGKKSGYRK